MAVTSIAAGPASLPPTLYRGTGEGYFNADAIQGAGIWKSTNGCNTEIYLTWTNAGAPSATIAAAIPPGLGAGLGKITHIAVSPLTRKRIYIGTKAGRILLVDSAYALSPVVCTLRPGTAGTSAAGVAVDPANEKHLLATYLSYSIVSAPETRDADAATPTWTNVKGSLPDMPVR